MITIPKKIGRLYFRDNQIYTAEDLRRGMKVFSNTLLKTRRHGVLDRFNFDVRQKGTTGNIIIIDSGYGFIRSTNDASYAIANTQPQEYPMDNPGRIDRIDSVFFVIDKDENVTIQVIKGNNINAPANPNEMSLRLADITRFPNGDMFVDNSVKEIEKETPIAKPDTVDIKPLNMFFFKHIDISKGGITQQKQHYEMEFMPTYSLPKKLGFAIYDSILKFKVQNRSKKSVKCTLIYRLGYYIQDYNGERKKATLRQWYGIKNVLANKFWEDRFDIDTWAYDGSTKQVIHYIEIEPYGRKMFLECYVEPKHLTLELKSLTIRDKIMQIKLYEDLRNN